MQAVAHLILYVADQRRSTEFYSTVLDCRPRLDVAGMTEFDLPGGAVLGLMPVAGIRQLLGERFPDPHQADGIPRAELYLLHPAAEEYHARAQTAGARELSPVQPRDWGHAAGYSLDLDGHVLAFARPSVPDAKSDAHGVDRMDLVNPQGPVPPTSRPSTFQ